MILFITKYNLSPRWVQFLIFLAFYYFFIYFFSLEFNFNNIANCTKYLNLTVTKQPVYSVEYLEIRDTAPPSYIGNMSDYNQAVQQTKIARLNSAIADISQRLVVLENNQSPIEVESSIKAPGKLASGSVESKGLSHQENLPPTSSSDVNDASTAQSKLPCGCSSYVKWYHGLDENEKQCIKSTAKYVFGGVSVAGVGTCLTSALAGACNIS